MRHVATATAPAARHLAAVCADGRRCRVRGGRGRAPPSPPLYVRGLAHYPRGAGAALTGLGHTAVGRPRGPDDDAHLPHLWAPLRAPATAGGALPDVRDVLVPPRGRARAGS